MARKRSSLKKRLFFTGLAGALVIVAVVGLIFVSSTHAFTPSYSPSNLIDNPTFINTASMGNDASSIQTFLTNIGSGLATYTATETCDSTIAPYYTHCGQTISAAQIIYDAAQAYGVNPRVILATMEKEQSLVTDPSPSASQINCAMGYNSCTNYAGFFTQVDNGTWTLKYNYEGAFQASTWLSWSPATHYACANGTTLYSAGLYPGNSVTFADPAQYDANGNLTHAATPETITIANAATASLYCYTPYVGPLSLTGYSGSYNFVYYYQLWFGATQVTTPYAWSYQSQAAYSDSAHTMPLTGTPTVTPGTKLYLQLQARNVGFDTWNQSSLHLGTSNPNDRTSVFYDSSWLDSARPAGLVETSVVPGATGIFNFTMDAPSQTGSYKEYFNLVDDGVTWLNDPGLYYAINVVNPISASNSSDTAMVPGQVLMGGDYLLSSDTQSVLALQKNGNLVLYQNLQQVWSTNTSGYPGAKLVMQTDGNLVLYDKNMNALWDSGTQGNANGWLNLQPDGNLVLYSQSNSPLWNTGTVDNPNNLAYVDTTMGTSFLYPGQSMYTANRYYRLVLQTDGNLVLYDKTMKAIWNSGTSGIPVEYLALQTDGNLVLYGINDNPVWYTATSGNAADYLIIQPDGNLVLYSQSNSPLWNTKTSGVL